MKVSIRCVVIAVAASCCDPSVTSAAAATSTPAANPDEPVFFVDVPAFTKYYTDVCAGTATSPPAFPTRLLPAASGKGLKFSVVVDSSQISLVEFKEEKRDTRISTDVTSLINKVLGISTPKAPEAKDPLCGHKAARWERTLTMERSTLTITATRIPSATDIAKSASDAVDALRGPSAQAADGGVVESPPSPGSMGQAAPAAAQSPAAKSKAKTPDPAATTAAATAAATQSAAPSSVGSTTVLVGPAEHMFLTLDLPVSNRKTLKYDSANGGTLQPTDSNPQFYAAFNWQLGDILSPPEGWFKSDRLAIKVSIARSPIAGQGASVPRSGRWAPQLARMLNCRRHPSNTMD